MAFPDQSLLPDPCRSKSGTRKFRHYPTVAENKDTITDLGKILCFD